MWWPHEQREILRQRGVALLCRIAAFGGEEEGMSTVEYAIGTVAAAAFGALLYTVLTGGSVASFLQKIIEKALTTSV
ncbi:hypothetical protein Srot_2606 [Segniliparus rotundus DSM 44985]|uniref:DUF4244 domain-containing protein n=1 Tax=Segniliparus rotundus (strain ATCC BAA-972 / CDC 1076 / CIP 108378 / DSM 44985 / JCM 13578) TaxID=640132 RepID=D6ZC72_SEGRD|nr:DUF4244 domain-containing protein [Segniliparus rotundus]ADG99041.1 hypothetical protein Srot_2606 [Segniliparus rotundus DSM 44985]